MGWLSARVEDETGPEANFFQFSGTATNKS